MRLRKRWNSLFWGEMSYRYQLGLTGLLYHLKFVFPMCMYAQSISHVWLFCDPMNCSWPGSSDDGSSQTTILVWIAISSSRGSSQPRNWTYISCVSCTSKWILYYWATWEALWWYSFLLIYTLMIVIREDVATPGLKTTTIQHKKTGECETDCYL